MYRNTIYSTALSPPQLKDRIISARATTTASTRFRPDVGAPCHSSSSVLLASCFTFIFERSMTTTPILFASNALGKRLIGFSGGMPTLNTLQLVEVLVRATCPQHRWRSGGARPVHTSTQCFVNINVHAIKCHFRIMKAIKSRGQIICSQKWSFFFTYKNRLPP